MGESKPKKFLTGLEQLKSVDFSCFTSIEEAKTSNSIKKEVLPLTSDNLTNDILKSPSYKIEFFDDCKSFLDKDEKFSNKILNTSQSSTINSRIISLLQLKGNEVLPEKIPLKYDAPLNLSEGPSAKRVSRIFSKRGIPIQGYEKWKYEDPSITNVLKNTKNDMLRVFTHKDKETNTLTIMIVDPHHLLATNKTNGFALVKSYGACMSQLSK